MRNTKERIMAIDLRRRRFGYAVLDGASTLIEWGSGGIWADGRIRGDITNTRLSTILRVSSPATVIVRKSQYRGYLGAQQKERILRRLKRYAAGYSIPVVMISQDEIKRAFHVSKRSSKYKIAAVVARRFPELRGKPPAERKAWKPEPHSMIIFDAIAVGIAHLEPEGVSEPPD